MFSFWKVDFLTCPDSHWICTHFNIYDSGILVAYVLEYLFPSPQMSVQRLQRWAVHCDVWQARCMGGDLWFRFHCSWFYLMINGLIATFSVQIMTIGAFMMRRILLYHDHLQCKQSWIGCLLRCHFRTLLLCQRKRFEHAVFRLPVHPKILLDKYIFDFNHHFTTIRPPWWIPGHLSIEIPICQKYS
jgi:hypothetical protein